MRFYALSSEDGSIDGYLDEVLAVDGFIIVACGVKGVAI